MLGFVLVVGAIAHAAEPFNREGVVSLDDMRSLIRTRFPIGYQQSELRLAFGAEGHATLKVLPDDVAVEHHS